MRWTRGSRSVLAVLALSACVPGDDTAADTDAASTGGTDGSSTQAQDGDGDDGGSTGGDSGSTGADDTTSDGGSTGVDTGAATDSDGSTSGGGSSGGAGSSGSGGSDSGGSEGGSESGESGAENECGDGIVGADEDCDDDNEDDYDGCTASCEWTIAEIVVTDRHTCIRTALGDVKCWGAWERIGAQMTENVGDDETPADIDFVELGAEAVDIVAGAYGACALLTTGGVRCFGTNVQGGLGLGLGADLLVGDDEPPTAFYEVDLGDVGNAEIVAIESMSISGTCVLLDDGDVHCWGDPRGMGANLGTGDPPSPFDPWTTNVGDDETPAEAGLGPVAVGVPAVELFPYDRGFLVRTASGAFRVWGGQDYLLTLPEYVSVAFLEDDATIIETGDVVFAGIETETIDFGDSVACALQDDGEVYCWGYDGGNGSIGIPGSNIVGGTEGTIPIAEAGPVDFGGPVAFLEVSGDFGCAVLQDETVRCWGSGAWGRTGHGDTEDVGDDETPAMGPVTDVDGTVVRFAETTFSTHMCALLDTGEIKCWGRNLFGQLGYGHADDIGDDPGEMGESLPAVDVF